MSILSQLNASGLTATAHTADGKTEQALLIEMKFKIYDLFPQYQAHKTIDFTNKSFDEFMDLLCEDKYEGYSTLIIGSQ